MAADQRNGWKITDYDQATDTYRLQASLDIGSEEDLGTFFQLGRNNHPQETLVVCGDVWIRPPRVSSKRSDGRARICNRLTLGDPQDPAINATLKIACTKAKEFGLAIGRRTKDQAEWAFRGDLHVYHSTITAATPDRAHLVAGYVDFDGVPTSWYGSDIRLIDATISWITDVYGVQAHNSVLEGATFEHGDQMITNGRQVIHHCTFRDLQVAVCEGGCLDATVIGCRFSDNERNWTLGAVQSGIVTGGIEMIDCETGPQRRPVDLRKNEIAPQQAIASHVPLYPTYTELRSLVVKVADAAGQPIPDAWVNVSCDTDANAVRRGLATTDERGLTPDDPEGQAILITQRKLQATDDPKQPREFSFRYEVSVQAAGYAPQRLTLAHDQSLPRPLTVALTRN